MFSSAYFSVFPGLVTPRVHVKDCPVMLLLDFLGVWNCRTAAKYHLISQFNERQKLSLSFILYF